MPAGPAMFSWRLSGQAGRTAEGNAGRFTDIVPGRRGRFQRVSPVVFGRTGTSVALFVSWRHSELTRLSEASMRYLFPITVVTVLLAGLTAGAQPPAPADRQPSHPNPHAVVRSW